MKGAKQIDLANVWQGALNKLTPENGSKCFSQFQWMWRCGVVKLLECSICLLTFIITFCITVSEY
jgi:hypothetical protein